MKTGIELIAQERKEQIEKHGWTQKHDADEHDNSELAYNAAILASPINLFTKETYANATVFEVAQTDREWNLPYPNQLNGTTNVIHDNEKLPKKKRIKQLIVAGALLAAEIDRLKFEDK